MNRSIIFGPFSALILTCVFGFRLLHMSRSKFGPTHKLIFDQFLKGKCFIRKDCKKKYKHAYSFNERNHYTKRIYRKSICYNSVAFLYQSMTNVLGSSSIWTFRILNFAFRIKFRYSEKATKNCAHLPLSFWQHLVVSNFQRKMGQIFVTFSEYLNFICSCFLKASEVEKK